MHKILLHFFYQKLQVQFVLFLLPILLYFNTLPNQWAIDDRIIIYENRFTQRGIAGLDSIFLTDAFYGYFGENQAVAGGRYRPISQAIFAIQAEFFAKNLKDDKGLVIKDKAGYVLKDLSPDSGFPFYVHLFNILIYGLLCVFIWNVLTLLFQSENNFAKQFMIFVAVVLFAIHPIHTEVVANAKSLDEILSLFGAFASLFFLLKYIDQSEKRIQNGILSVSCFILALFSKENSITFLAILPLSIFFFRLQEPKNILKITLPFLVIALFYVGIRSQIVIENTLENDFEMMNNPFLQVNQNIKLQPLHTNSKLNKVSKIEKDSYIQMPFINQMAFVTQSAGIYLKLLVFPYNLTCDYNPKHIQPQLFTYPTVLLSLILHILLLILAVYYLPSKNIISFGILYYFITISIVSNVFFNIGTPLAERFLFMPSLGFCLILASILTNLISKIKLEAVLGILLIISVLYSIRTITRNFDWKDNKTLFSNDIKISKNSVKMNLDYAGVVFEEAKNKINKNIDKNNQLSADQLVDSLKIYEKEWSNEMVSVIPNVEKTLEMHPINAGAWLLYGSIHFNLALLEKNPNQGFNLLLTCISAYEQAYKISNLPIFKSNLAAGYREMGKFLGSNYADFQKAVFFLEKSLNLDSQNPETYFILGTAYHLTGNFEKSIKSAETSLKLNPNNLETEENLATIYQLEGERTKNNNLIEKSDSLLQLVFKKEIEMQTGKTRSDKIGKTTKLIFKNYKLLGSKTREEEFKSKLMKITF